MALAKSKELKNGFSVEYWRVSPTMVVDMVERTASSTLLAYKDKAARDAGKGTVDTHSIEGFSDVHRVELSGKEFEDAIKTGEMRDAMYSKLKVNDFFSGSTDVLET